MATRHGYLARFLEHFLSRQCSRPASPSNYYIWQNRAWRLSIARYYFETASRSKICSVRWSRFVINGGNSKAGRERQNLPVTGPLGWSWRRVAIFDTARPPWCKSTTTQNVKTFASSCCHPAIWPCNILIQSSLRHGKGPILSNAASIIHWLGQHFRNRKSPVWR